MIHQIRKLVQDQGKTPLLSAPRLNLRGDIAQQRIPTDGYILGSHTLPTQLGKQLTGQGEALLGGSGLLGQVVAVRLLRPCAVDAGGK